MKPLLLCVIVAVSLVAASCGSLPKPSSPWGDMKASAATPAAAVDPREKLVRSFNAAFNSQDATAMASMVTSDVQWLAVRGDAVRPDTRNKEELLRSMLSYFKSCPTCRSRLAQVIVTKMRVSVLEVTTWTAPGGAKREAQGFVIYEFEGKQFATPRISRVYYFPEET